MFFFAFNIFRGLYGLLAIPFAIAAAVWTYFDARKRGYAEWVWAGVAFSIFPFGFFGYLVYRAIAGQRVR